MNNVLDFNKEIDVSTYSSITLAFIGDAVYSLYIREKIIRNGDKKGVSLNKEASEIVCAKAQAKKMDKLMDVLNEEELSIYKRGRNTKKHTFPKNTDVATYNKATGFEALIGYLYLKGSSERLNYLFEYGEEANEDWGKKQR